MAAPLSITTTADGRKKARSLRDSLRVANAADGRIEPCFDVPMPNGPAPDSALWMSLVAMLTASVIALVSLLLAYGFAL